MSDRASGSRLRNLAREALRKHGDVDLALTHLIAAVKLEPQLMRYLLRPYVVAEHESRSLGQKTIVIPGQRPDIDASRPYSRKSCVVRPGQPTAMQIKRGLIVKNEIALSILHTYKIGGKAWADWTWREAKGHSRLQLREGYILKRSAEVAVPVDPDAKLGAILKVKDAERIMQEAVEFANVA